MSNFAKGTVLGKDFTQAQVHIECTSAMNYMGKMENET